MKLFVAIGNPEPEYQHTRHNVGKDFLNYWREKEFDANDWKYDKYIDSEIISPNANLILVKTCGYMNSVGDIVAKVIRKCEVDLNDLCVVYDELDLFIGEYKLAYQKGSRIHNGIQSVKDRLTTDAFWHLRIGVRDLTIPASVQKTGRDPSEYVLQKFPTQDQNALYQMYTNKLIKELQALVA